MTSYGVITVNLDHLLIARWMPLVNGKKLQIYALGLFKAHSLLQYRTMRHKT